MFKSIAALLFLLVLALAACDDMQPPPKISQIPYAADSGNIAIRCGTLIDGLSDEAGTDRIVVIRNGRFERIASGNASVATDVPFLNLSEYTCLPGLINAHVHLAERPEDSVDYGIYYARSEDDHNALTLDMAQVSLLTGFTTVRNVGDFFPNAIYYGREQIRTGIARGADEFREKAELAVAEGADFLKVIASGAVFSFGVPPGSPEMTREEIDAVVEVAKKAGITVSAHVHSAQSGKDAVLAGVDTLEHGSLLDDETIALVAEHGVSLSMDVYNGTYTDTVGREQGYPEEYLRRNFDTTETQRVVFEKAYASGIPILYGTDGGVLPHDMGGWQFGIMVERGMAPMDAVKSATSVAAEHMNMAGDVGAVEAGRFGDLIAVRSNPLDDMEVMKTVDVVIKGGLLFKNE